MIFDHIKYLEKIARESVDIKHTDEKPHFSIASGYTQAEQLMQNALRSNEVQLIAIDDLSGSYDNDDSINLYDTQSCSFMVLKHVSDLNNMVETQTARKQCQLIARKIFARMRYDQYLAQKNIPINDSIGLRQLNQNSFQYFSVGPIGDNYFGIDISFTVGTPESMKYNPDDWTENEQVIETPNP